MEKENERRTVAFSPSPTPPLLHTLPLPRLVAAENQNAYNFLFTEDKRYSRATIFGEIVRNQAMTTRFSLG